MLKIEYHIQVLRNYREYTLSDIKAAFDAVEQYLTASRKWYKPFSRPELRMGWARFYLDKSGKLAITMPEHKEEDY